jgi:hypothetical protein
MKLKLSATLTGLVAALAIPTAQANDLIRFDDSGESVSLWLNGVQVSGSGLGPISNLSFSPVVEPGGGSGEVILFDYAPNSPVPLQLFDGTTPQLPYIYTQLYEAGPNGINIVSDEFAIRQKPGAFGVYEVAFTSADQALIPAQFPGVNLVISPLSGLEIASYQDVGFIATTTGAAGAGSVVTTFQVNSVPEPASYAMLVGGLGVLALLRRRQG